VNLLEASGRPFRTEFTPQLIADLEKELERTIEDSKIDRVVDYDGNNTVKIKFTTNPHVADFKRRHPESVGKLKQHKDVDHAGESNVSIVINIKFHDIQNTSDVKLRGAVKTKLSEVRNTILQKFRHWNHLHVSVDKISTERGSAQLHITVAPTYPINANHQNNIKMLDKEAVASKTEQYVEEAVSLLTEHCMTAVREVHSVSEDGTEALYRGFKNSDPVAVKRVRKERQPTDTDFDTHMFIDEWFNTKFGHRFRSNAMFATADVSIAAEYGHAYAVFPSNKYTLIFSSTYDDLFSVIDNMSTKKRSPDELKEILEKGQYAMADLDEYLDSGLEAEVMIACDHYVAIDRLVWKKHAAEIMKRVLSETK